MDKAKRSQVLNEFGQKHKLTGLQVESKWKSLKALFNTERRNKAKESRSGAGAKKKSTWRFFDEMNCFLSGNIVSDSISINNYCLAVNANASEDSIDNLTDNLDEANRNDRGFGDKSNLSELNERNVSKDNSNFGLLNEPSSRVKNNDFILLSPPQSPLNDNLKLNPKENVNHTANSYQIKDQELLDKIAKAKETSKFRLPYNKRKFDASSALGSIFEIISESRQNVPVVDDDLDTYLKSLKPQFKLFEEDPQLLKKTKLSIQITSKVFNGTYGKGFN